MRKTNNLIDNLVPHLLLPHIHDNIEPTKHNAKQSEIERKSSLRLNETKSLSLLNCLAQFVFETFFRSISGQV